MSALVTEPKSLPSALACISNTSSIAFTRRSISRNSAIARFWISPITRRWCSICFTRAAVASIALPCGNRKLRPNPAFTFTTSPALPRRWMSSVRMTSMVAIYACPVV